MKVIPFVPRDLNNKIDEELSDQERAKALEQLADIEHLFLDIDRRLERLIEDVEE